MFLRKETIWGDHWRNCRNKGEQKENPVIQHSSYLHFPSTWPPLVCTAFRYVRWWTINASRHPPISNLATFLETRSKERWKSFREKPCEQLHHQICKHSNICSPVACNKIHKILAGTVVSEVWWDAAGAMQNGFCPKSIKPWKKFFEKMKFVNAEFIVLNVFDAEICLSVKTEWKIWIKTSWWDPEQFIAPLIISWISMKFVEASKMFEQETVYHALAYVFFRASFVLFTEICQFFLEFSVNLSPITGLSLLQIISLGFGSLSLYHKIWSKGCYPQNERPKNIFLQWNHSQQYRQKHRRKFQWCFECLQKHWVRKFFTIHNCSVHNRFSPRQSLVFR